MKHLLLLFLLVSGSAHADQEFCCYGTTHYVQESADPTPKPPDGFVRIGSGVCMTIAVGVLPKEVVLKISETEVVLNLASDKDTLSAENRQKFLAGTMITLSSGRRIQFFRDTGGTLSRQIVLYLPDGRLSEIKILGPKQ